MSLRSYNCIKSFIRNSSVRLIMTSASRSEKALEDLKTNAYFNKYAEKIAKLQETSPEEFLERIEQQKQAKAKPKFGGIKERQYSSLLTPKQSAKNEEPVKTKSLNDIMKLDLVKDKDAAEIKSIWEEYHKTKDVICATIPLNLYQEMEAKSKKYGIFIFPLPRSQGYEFFMLQFAGTEVHFTPLLCYQVHKENAPECLTIFHYTELLDKGIVLMRGEFDKNVLDAKEAQCLANQLQMYYGQKNEAQIALMEKFTFHSADFKHTELIAQLENLTL